VRSQRLGWMTALACGLALATGGTAAAADSCVNAGIRATEMASLLPDCRAYEMVSPPEKHGGDVSPLGSRTRAAVDGDTVQLVSMAGFDAAHGTNALGTEYISERSAAGWSTHGIDPPQLAPAFPTWTSRYLGDFSDDLGTGVYFALSPVTSADPNVANVRNLYLRRDLLVPGPGSYQLLTGCPACASPLVPPPFSLAALDPQLAGASAGFRHVIFESPLNLTVDASGSGPKLYESVDGNVRLAGVLPDSACATPPCPAPESVAGLGALNVSENDTGQYTPHAISADGSRIVFTAGPFVDSSSLGASLTGARAGDLYMRIDGSSTIQLNVSERSTPDPNGHQPALYGGASQDGSKVFFMTTEKLTDDATGGADLNLYMYDVDAPAGHHLTLITRDSEPSDDFAGLPKAVYVAGTSEDGSYVYFFGSNALIAGQTNPEGTAAKLLYVWHDGTLRFLATDGGFTQLHTNWGEDGLSNATDANEFRVSPDGRHIAFATRNSATAQRAGFDNSSASCASGACAEVYRYSYDSDRLTCVSCDSGGRAPAGDAEITSTGSVDPTFLTVTRHLSHSLSDDGRYVFFDTPDPLVARDTNGKRDVYEYDATTGLVSLISTGRSDSDSLFVEATPSGNDVFFATRQQLVGIDTDQATDLYDARVGGGIEAQNPPPRVPCSGIVCHGAPPSAAPPLPLLGVTSQTPPGRKLPVARIHVLRRSAHGSVLVLVVRVPAAGRISVRGRSVKSLLKTVSRAGTYRLRVRLTAHARRLLRHRHVLRVRLRIGYRPVGGRLSSVAVSIRVRGEGR
jgi:hypothetical protein